MVFYVVTPCSLEDSLQPEDGGGTYQQTTRRHTPEDGHPVTQTSRFYGPGVDSASNRNEFQESSRGKGRPARKADLTVTCEPTV
jgi:hypothetical protein